MTPYESDDLTHVIEASGDTFLVLRSPDTAEDRPDYRELARFSTQEQANSYLATLPAYPLS
jgi:hypothetical protein